MRIFSCVSNFVQHPILGHTQEDKDVTIRSKFLIFITKTFLEYRFIKIRILKMPWIQIYLWRQMTVLKITVQFGSGPSSFRRTAHFYGTAYYASTYTPLDLTL